MDIESEYIPVGVDKSPHNDDRRKAAESIEFVREIANKAYDVY